MAEPVRSGLAPDWRGRELASGRRGMAFAAGSGVLAGLGQVPFDLVPLSLFGFAAGFVLCALASNWRAGFRTGWVFGTGYFALTLHWIVEPFLIDLARHGWMAPFALIFLSAGLALFWGAAFALARRLAGRPLVLALVWSGAMGLVELARGYVLTGFPWVLPGYIWVDTPALGLAALVGPYGLTLATLLATALFGAAALERRPGAIAAAAIFAGLLLGLTVLSPHGPAPVSDDRPTIRLVQPNAPQEEKWDAERVNFFFHRQLGFSAGGDGPRPDLIVWPETAIPWDLSDSTLARTMVAEAGAGVPMAIGIQRLVGARAYNSLAIVDAEGEVSQIYDKHHLVPFGEYIPLGDLAAGFGLTGFATRDGNGFSPGPGPVLLDLGALGRALPLICYEAIFPQSVTRAPERPDWLLQVTNDAWFGKTAGPQQHLAQARFRAAEQGLPLVRVANTGISAMIDPYGRITASFPLGEAGYVDAVLPAPLAPTPYARMGDGPALIAALFLIALASGLGFRKTD